MAKQKLSGGLPETLSAIRAEFRVIKVLLAITIVMMLLLLIKGGI